LNRLQYKSLNCISNNQNTTKSIVHNEGSIPVYQRGDGGTLDFGAVVALVALIGAALLALGRQN
jgi:hypothetical protein